MIGNKRVYLLYLLKKSYIILACAIIVSLGLYIEKANLTPIVPETGNITFTQNVRIQPINPVELDLTTNGSKNIATIEPYFSTWGFMKGFITHSKSDFDYSQFNKNWNNLEWSEKADWMNQHFHITYLGNNVYEFVLQFAATDAKSSDYVQNHGKEFLHNYIEAGTQSYSKINPVQSIQYLDFYEFEDRPQAVNKQTIVLHYTIAGFVLGLFLGLTVVTLYYKIRVEKKTSNN